MRPASSELCVPRAIAASVVALAAVIAAVMFGGCARAPAPMRDAEVDVCRALAVEPAPSARVAKVVAAAIQATVDAR